MRRLALPILIALVAVSCSSVADATTTQSVPANTTETSTTIDSTASTAGSTTTTGDNSVVSLPDGDRQFAYVTAVEKADDGTWILTADYAQWLTGEEANDAARNAGEITEGETVPNDYYIVNENPRLRELNLDPDSPVALNACFIDGECVTVVEISVEQWLAVLDGEIPTELGAGFQWYGNGFLPYWLIFEGETIVGIEEQYLP